MSSYVRLDGLRERERREGGSERGGREREEGRERGGGREGGEREREGENVKCERTQRYYKEYAPDVGYHDSSAVASKRILQQSGQLAVPVRNVDRLRLQQHTPVKIWYTVELLYEDTPEMRTPSPPPSPSVPCLRRF